jgi:hypothetical protein
LLSRAAMRNTVLPPRRESLQAESESFASRDGRRDPRARDLSRERWDFTGAGRTGSSAEPRQLPGFLTVDDRARPAGGGLDAD